VSGWLAGLSAVDVHDWSAIDFARAAPTRRPNSEYRKREHLTPAEVAKLIEAAKRNRHGQRDATMILVAYRHGFRASEVCDLVYCS
jgi:integrase